MDTTSNLAVPQFVNHQFSTVDASNDPVFISQRDEEHMTLSNTPSLEPMSSNEFNSQNEKYLTRPQSLISRNSLNVALRPSELLEEIQYDELNKLKAELKRAKYELSEMADTHHDEINNFHVMVKKIKTQSDCVGFIKDQKQRTSMKKIQSEYENELEKINGKLRITQNLHIAEIKKLKKSEIKHKLEMKLKNKKIKELTQENEEITASKLRMKNDHDVFLETLKKKYDEEMEQEVNKRISRISQLNRAKSKLMNELKDRQSSVIEMDEEIDLNKDDGDDELIQSLKNDIKRLEKNNERNENMFFKHNQIFEYKLERETKEKNEKLKALKDLQDLHERETQEFNDKIMRLKQELSQQTEANIHLQQSLEMIYEQNTRLKDVESEYQLFAAHIDADYGEMNTMMEELQNKNVEKEQELNKIKEFISVKENENKNLRTSVNAHSETIKELESTLKALKMNEAMLENKQKEIDDINSKIENQERTMDFKKNVDEAMDAEKVMDDKVTHRYSISHLSHTVEDEVHLKHIGQIESMKAEYSILINDMKRECDSLHISLKDAQNELSASRRLLEETENSKVTLLGNFAMEMDRMRAEIKKQNGLKVRGERHA